MNEHVIELTTKYTNGIKNSAMSSFLYSGICIPEL